MYAVQKDQLEIVTMLVDTGVLEFSKTNKASTNNIIISIVTHIRERSRVLMPRWRHQS